MPQPLVSVIVPAYNAAGFISRCVESIIQPISTTGVRSIPTA